jgi:hypothetical protein
MWNFSIEGMFLACASSAQWWELKQHGTRYVLCQFSAHNALDLFAVVVQLGARNKYMIRGNQNYRHWMFISLFYLNRIVKVTLYYFILNLLGQRISYVISDTSSVSFTLYKNILNWLEAIDNNSRIDRNTFALSSMIHCVVLFINFPNVVMLELRN